MNINLNLSSNKRFAGGGSTYSITEFIEACECGGLIDYDGFADEIILNGRIVWSALEETNDWLYPSDILENKDKLLNAEKLHKELQIVWYNK